MMRFVAFVVVLLITAGLAVAQQQQQNPAGAPAADQGPKPKAEFATKVKDFGAVPKGQKLQAVFEVKNLGEVPLEIVGVRPTCGCTVANFDRTVPPGGTGKVQAEVDTRDFAGPIAKAVLVFTNDKENAQVNLIIKADVRTYLEVLPRPLVRFNVLQGEAAAEKLTVVSAEGSAFKMLSAESDGPYQVAFRELPEKERLADRAGSQWEVTITVPATAAEGMINHKVVLKTDSPKAPEVTINLTGVVRPIVQIVPAEVNFGTVPADAPVGRNVILINNRQGNELQLTKVEVDTTDFKAEVVPLQAGQRFQIAVSMPAGLSKGAHKATLRIATNDPSRKLIEVPVQAVVQ